MADFNWVDYLILAVFFLSILVGLMRGILREILALFTWIGAFVVASLFSNQLASLFTTSQAGQSVISGTTSAVGLDTAHSVSIVSIGLSFVCLFLATLIVGALISRAISAAAESTGIGVANRLFGGIFGFLRGFLVNLVIVFVVQLTTVDKEPMWTSSKLVPIFQPAAAWIGNMVHPGLENLKTVFENSINNAQSAMSSFDQFRG